MTGPPDPDDVRRWAHVDHDLSQLIGLHVTLNDPGYGLHSETVRRAMDVAYAAHFRTVMEFAHAKRPKKKERHREDITSERLLGHPLREEWTSNEEDRLADADKLVGHLSDGRLEREGRKRRWGGPEDLGLWEPIFSDLIAEAREHLPKSVAAWDALRRAGTEVEGRQRAAMIHAAFDGVAEELIEKPLGPEGHVQVHFRGGLPSRVEWRWVAPVRRPAVE